MLKGCLQWSSKRTSLFASASCTTTCCEEAAETRLHGAREHAFNEEPRPCDEDTLDRQLASHEGPFLLGSQLTLADLAVAPFIERVQLVLEPIKV